MKTSAEYWSRGMAEDLEKEWEKMTSFYQVQIISSEKNLKKDGWQLCQLRESSKS